MNPLSESIKGLSQVNPFKDSQAKNFSNKKLVDEFCPTKFYWDLFNDQHEILIGTRGSGKTVLLRMMQYSLLRNLKDPKAKLLTLDKKYIALYVPTNIEFLRSVNPVDTNVENKVRFFQFGFNCFLAQSLISELKSIILDVDESRFQQVLIENHICDVICRMWFEGKKMLNSLDEVSFEIDNLYHNFNFYVQDAHFDNVPPIFINSIGKPIQSISKHIYGVLKIHSEPIWLICIDEAEFLDLPHQVCINSLFRAHSQGIVIKMATLPFKHKTRETFVTGVLAEPNGNDFNYRNIELDPDCDDFMSLTDRLCQSRMSKIFSVNDNVSLSGFLGVVGNDNLIDYYKKELNVLDIDRASIESELIEQFSVKRKESAIKNGIGSRTNRKQVYDKFVPVFFVREMFKISKRGNRIPGFYAGASMVRKAAEGNPRIFIQIMNQLFERARMVTLNEKQQHNVIMEFAEQQCNITQRLPDFGSQLSKIISEIAFHLHSITHNGELKDSGSTFYICNNLLLDSEFVNALQLGCAYSRLKIDQNSLFNGIDRETEFSLSNLYAIKYWIPMRKSGSVVNWSSAKMKFVENDLKQEGFIQGEFNFEQI